MFHPWVFLPLAVVLAGQPAESDPEKEERS